MGLARSGRAAVAALRGQGDEVVAYDVDDGVDVAGVDAEVALGAWDERLLDGVELVVKSPGVPSEAPPVLSARARRTHVVSEIELAARLLQNPLVGVTGTNGKTTTTALLGAILDAGQVAVEVAGNIGRPLSSLVGRVTPETWIVCELSSFQLEDVETLRPRVAVLTNLEPDHLDRHGGLEEYEAAKLRVFELQRADDVAVVPRGFRSVPGNGPSDRVRRGRCPAGRAADPRARTIERTPPPRPRLPARSASTTTPSRARSERSPASSTGSKRSRRSAGCSS